MHGMEEERKQANASQTNEEEAFPEATVMYDGMAVVNITRFGPVVQNYRQVAEAFLIIVSCEAGNALEIRVVVDRYLESAWKESTQEKRCRGLELTEYEIVDNTSLKKIHSMRKFLSHINTKQRLTLVDTYRIY